MRPVSSTDYRGNAWPKRPHRLTDATQSAFEIRHFRDSHDPILIGEPC